MRKSPRLVLDTNILVAAVRSRLGPSFALIQLIRIGRVQMCCSPALFLEYEAVLKRPTQLQASGLLAQDIDAILNELAGLIAPIRTHYQWRPQLKDPADEMVLEAAVNAQAQALVTFNARDFGPSARFGLAVRNPAQVFVQFQLPRNQEFPP